MGHAIVIDVSVARAAGTSGKPIPEACRRVLVAVRDFGHVVAMSQGVYNEWIKLREGINGNPTPYASLIALQWLTDMRSSGRVDDVALEENSALRQICLQGLQNNHRTSSSVDPIMKDFHLVETALKSDKRVLSLDKKMFDHLRYLQDIANEVCQVMWVGPITDHAEEWLQNGAVDTPAYHVCACQE